MTNVYDEASIVDTLAAGIAELQASLTKRDYADKCRLEAYAERNETIAQLRADHNACADEALIADTTIAERDATIATLRTDQAALNDDVLADAAHKQLRAEVAERDEAIEVYEALVARHEQTISERDATIEQHEATILKVRAEKDNATAREKGLHMRVYDLSKEHGNDLDFLTNRSAETVEKLEKELSVLKERLHESQEWSDTYRQALSVETASREGFRSRAWGLEDAARRLGVTKDIERNIAEQKEE